MFTNTIIFRLSQILRGLGFNFNESNNPNVQELQREMKSIGTIKFNIEFYPDGSWAAESVNIDGIITGGKDVKNVNATIKDAIFTFFRIPPHLVNDNLLKTENEPTVVSGRVFAAK